MMELAFILLMVVVLVALNELNTETVL